MFDSILVPTDGSDHARRAAAHAGALAEAVDATVHLVSAVDLDAEAGPFSAGGIGEEYLDELKAEAREDVEATTGALAGVDTHTEVVTGRPSEAIVGYADDAGVDLVAMGTHGRTGLRRQVLGSVAERVISHASVPVLAVRAPGEDAATDPGTYEEILVPTGSDGPSETALSYAFDLAQRADARIHAVHAVSPGPGVTSADLAMPSSVLSALTSAGEEATEVVADRARAAGLAAVTEVRGGRPSKALVEYADENGVDCIVMATAGRSGLSRFLLGSTTEAVVRRAPHPVFTVDEGRDAES